MRTVIQRFFSFTAENVVPEIYAALGLVYLILLFVTLASVSKTQTNGKLAWFMIVLLLPMLGMYFYAFWSLIKADYSFLTRLGFARSRSAPFREVQKSAP
ncbi:MAG TPA: hypothetical protein DIT64_11465 [Verrucomicrobiales bacterium]|nr:hypothetical protein [Verrucomicrobiales bacterium]